VELVEVATGIMCPVDNIIALGTCPVCPGNATKPRGIEALVTAQVDMTPKST